MKTKEQIKQIVCDVFGITDSQLIMKTRKEEIAKARQIGMYFTRKYVNKRAKISISYQIIGNYYGKDHATVVHSCHAVQDMIDTNDQKYIHLIEAVEEKINNIDAFNHITQL